jgi:superfamily II DNA or RNA helicase
MLFNVGDKVRSRNYEGVGRIDALGPFDAALQLQYYEVFWGGSAGIKNVPGIDLEPAYIEEKPSSNFVKSRLGGYRDFQRLITHHRLSRTVSLRNNIYAFNASRTRFYPYQFKPLVKFLDSPHHRLLICDEVGLGKTIEAGLILTELRARQSIRRVLVACPANLTPKWKIELKRRFGEEFDILKVDDLLEYLEEYESDPDRAKLNGIVSLETARQDKILQRLDELSPQFDLVIVDEAHHLRNFGTKQRRAGALLTNSADAVVFLTATPIHLGNENLFSLLNILDSDDFPDSATADARFRENEPVVLAQTCLAQFPPNLNEAAKFLERCRNFRWFIKNPLYINLLENVKVLSEQDGNSENFRRDVVQVQRDMSELNLLAHIFTRSRKREVHANAPARHAYALELSLMERERAFYHAVSNFVRAECEARGTVPLIQQWRLNMPQRRMASCIPAMVNYYRNYLGLDASDAPEDDEPPNAAADDSNENASNLESARETLKGILSTWSSDAVDTKYQRFITTLREVRSKQEGRCKVLVFAFFKDTLRYLAGRLQTDGFAAVTIDGDTPAAERPAIIDRFYRDEHLEVLLSSRVGGEGLDFQFCNTMFNYDLPWNPMEVEQRIGRLDRIGQESPIIHIYNLWIEGTVEERILRRLYDRVRVFERSIGGLEAILGEVTKELEANIFSKSLSPEEEALKLEQAIWTLEKKISDVERLESQAARFFGTDQYFNEEVDAIRNRRRYVTGEQLRRYLMDFLRYKAPKTRLEYDRDTKKGRLFPDHALKTFLQFSGRTGDMPTLMAAGDKGMEVTFDSQVAFQEPRTEFINVLHPLVLAINDDYQRKGLDCRTAQHIMLATKQLPSGFYYYFVNRVRIEGAIPRNTLECIVLDAAFEEACDPAIAEAVFGEMTEMGEEPIATNLEVEDHAARGAYDASVKLFFGRLNALRRDFERSNNLFVENRLVSLNAFYEKEFKKRLDIINRTKQEPRIQRMQESMLRRQQAERETKVRELQQQRKVAVSYDEVAAGILEVV